MLKSIGCGFSTRQRARGFSLIELMISVLIGMIVVAGAVSLIVAIDRSNSETIQSTRLTQELRSLAAVIADDVKRTRRIDDPIAMVGQGTTKACATTPVTPAQPCYQITTTAKVASVPTCLTYGYSGTTSSRTLYNYRSARLATTGGVGAVLLDEYTFDPDPAVNAAGTALPTTAVATACPITGSTAYTVSSSQVNITSLCFSSSTDTGSCYFDTATSSCKLNTTAPASNEIDMCIAGKLLAGDTYTKTITRAFVQPIFIRSSSPN